MELAIVPLGQIESTNLIGGKARALSQLIQAGFMVPPGYAVTTTVFGAMNSELKSAVLGSLDMLKVKKVAVRSSAVNEDGKDAAWAGQMDTFLNVGRRGVLTAVERCWSSANSPRAVSYARQRGLKVGPVAVIVQAMINGKTSGVAFSTHPVTQDDKQMIVEAVPGLAESLVSGNATPDSYVLDKVRGGVIEERINHRRPLLSAPQLKELKQVICAMEKYFGFPVDVEWTIHRGKLFILQSRPITTLG